MVVLLRNNSHMKEGDVTDFMLDELHEISFTVQSSFDVLLSSIMRYRDGIQLSPFSRLRRLLLNLKIRESGTLYLLSTHILFDYSV